MSFNFQFKTVESRSDLSQLLEFLRPHDLGYPNYHDWVSKTEAEIDMGYKTGVIALNNGVVLGNIVWQPHKEISRTREIKNMRVNPKIRRRYFASFLMKQAEKENPGDFDALILDFREDHPQTNSLIDLLVSMGYEKICATNLYDPNVRDIIMVKNLSGIQKHL